MKDLSFENPNAPAVFQWQSQPQIEVEFNIGIGQLGDDLHEVALKIEITRDRDRGRSPSAVELLYAGLFAMRNVPADQLQPFLLAEAPRILFPFARQIVVQTRAARAASRRCCSSRSISRPLSAARRPQGERGRRRAGRRPTGLA